MRIRYFFTNKRDITPNNFIWHAAPRPLRILDVKSKLAQLGVVDAQSHLRFLDKIKGENVWLDIINDEVECPTNSEGVVDIKIVQQFHEASQAFLTDVFRGIPADAYEGAVMRLRELLLEGSSKGKSQGKSQEKSQRKVDPESGYAQFEEVEPTEELAEEMSGLGIQVEENELEEINEDAGKFDINFNDSQIPEEPSAGFDFLNDTVDASFVPKPRTDSKDIGDLANLLDSNVMASPTQPPTQSKLDGILNLNFGNPSKPRPKSNLGGKKTAHETQIDAQQEKLEFANEIDPMVTKWAKDPMTGTFKDIRSLLISLKGFLKHFDIEFEKIMLSQVMSKGAVKKMYYKVIRKIHPDKTNETAPKILYMLERITEIVNDAFKKHKTMA